mmetsp:Transcript_19656/g.42954  ORF Transcript_19656/g.42954 Transcript_19656/m.42954 type:complete len:1106 (-) Transcript_19656:700-4017(-)|eukprot:CAMPEP_0118934554 /NCGR_PEP_ID=MMETSP1169-20130426/13890_1 /TAXON_ID=36882 /ORGANISM="Pyramimonas obovata, Strain CCMP722" /LENGTH=1105 /DNA_ID=CAMNT_0006877473 /DNA_START=399 /DNA_END=3716 /DNA_ORIENTATION=+
MASEGINENENPAIVEAPEDAMVVDAKPADDGLEGSYVWKVHDFSKVKDRMHYSESFTVAGFKWRVLMFPKGNNADYLSVYLDVANSNELPYQWSRFANFKLLIRSQVNDKFNIVKDASHHFNARESDWGFTQFMQLNELHDNTKGYVVDDTVIVEAVVNVRKNEASHYAYDSKKETGYVGLKNQGATCYMNSLLQTLFHIPYFRKAVYHMPTTEEDVASKNIPLALQSLFYKVQFHDTSVATKDLTRSFGWDANESFMQHDVQELNRVLCDKLEEKMKSTTVQGTIQHLFEGHIVNYIECMNVDYKSTRKEAFLDLQLDVKGCKNVYESFDKYVETEQLTGDNKYRAEGHGLQDAKKGVLFQDFPPVLELQLKRFEYDFQRDTMVKINERYEFPQELDLDRDNFKYLTEDADKSVRNLYALHSVLVHSGGIHGGHYYAFIRPNLEGQWYKFDDERVTKETESKATEEQFGGEDETPPHPGFNNPPAFKYTKHSNAYMLVYIRKEDKDRIICPVTNDDIAQHLQERFKREQEEKERKRKEKSEAHLFTILKVARDADMKAQIGNELFFDLVDHDKVKTFRVRKETPFLQFKEQVAQELGIPVQFQRYWQWAKRQNHTYRPNRPIMPAEDTMTVLQVKESASHHVKNTAMDLKLYLEEYYGPDSVPRPLPVINKGDILLFFKLYDPVTSTLSYVGKMFANNNARMIDLLEDINLMAGFPADEQLLLFEEIKFEPNVMCETIDRRATLSRCQLEDGDIICFQRSIGDDEHRNCRHRSVPDFLEYIRHRQLVHFRKLEKPKEDDITLELSKQHTYDDVTARLAAELKVEDPAMIRLTAHNGYSQAPRPQPFKYYSVERLNDMLVHCHQMSDILYYEVLDIPLPELERLKILKVAFHNHKTEMVGEHQVRLPKESCVEDVLNALREKLGPTVTGELRMLEVCYSRIYKVFQPSEKIEAINDQYWTLRVEENPAEEGEMGPNDRLINVYHFTRDTHHQNNNQIVHNFAEPFFLRVGEKETLAEVKVRIQAKLEVTDEEFAKWKFAFCAVGRPEYLEDTDTIANRFTHSRRDWGGQWEYYLGLEHEDKGGRRANTNQTNRYNYEKPVKIWN